jgi:hypothetical protein
MGCIHEGFDLNVILENLDCLPGLLELHLVTLNTDRSSLLGGIIHLENLQIFTYHADCTDDIIAQLQQYCPHLMELDVSYSHGVTNASVQPLRAARKLTFLILDRTGIDDEHYGLLLSELPNVANIIVRRNEASILRHIPVERLDTITHAKSYIQNIVTDEQMGCNRSIGDIDRIMVDLSGLSAFNALRILEIHGPCFNSPDIKTLFVSIINRSVPDLLPIPSFTPTDTVGPAVATFQKFN